MYQVEPVRKLFYTGPMFRRERPQKGRQRQFYQIGAEVLGRGDPLIDAELLLLLNHFFTRLGLDSVTLELNSLGCIRCRPAYREKLLTFLREHADQLCENCSRRMERNPLRVLDCKEPSCIEATRDAPSILDHLCADCREHFDTVQRLLGQGSVAYKLNPRMVRGLDYYCRTTFEWTSGQLGAQNAVAAGGRYDGLVADLGGPPTPGVGFAMGMERLVLLLSAREMRQSPRPAVFIVWVGDAGRDWAFPAAQRLRRHGLSVEMEGEKKSLKSQMRRADKLRARHVLIVGEDELSKGVAVLRDMDNKEQTELKLDSYEDALLTKLALPN
jgi:histidyl-tRNA synthetase